MPTLSHPFRRWLFLTGVLLLAAGGRLWQIAAVPPGLYLDEAFHLLRAQEILRGEAWPVFITGNRGYEPLFVYLAAIPLAILGPVSWAGRLAAAWAGLISVAVTIRAGQELFPRQGVGALGGFFLASMVWALTFSRFGSQPVLAAPAAAGAVAALVHGARRNSWRAYALSGLCLGLGLDSYVGMRLFPGAMALIGLTWLVARRSRWRNVLAGGALAAVVAGLIYAPLMVFFLREPQWFWGRFGETTASTLGGGQPALGLAANVLRTLGGLLFHGDDNWRHNVAGRPALDVAAAFFFLVGMWASWRDRRRPETWTLWIWLIVGLAPSMLTFEAPHFGRAMMALPAIVLAAAFGLAVAWRRFTSFFGRGLILLSCGLSTILSLQAFWGQWAKAGEHFVYFEVQQTWLAQALQGAPAPGSRRSLGELTAPETSGARLYATPLHRDYYHELWPLEYLLGPEAYRRFGSFDGGRCAVLPASAPAGARYAIVTPDDPDTPAMLQAAFPGIEHYTSQWRAGAPYLEVYEVPAGQAAQIQPATPRHADYEGLVEMVGYTLRLPQNTVQLEVVWRTKQTTRIGYKVFVHLLGTPHSDGNPVYAQQDMPPCQGTYPAWQWHPDELIVETYTLALPPDLPRADYTLQIGWYEEGGARLMVSDDTGAPIGDALRLETLSLPQP